MTKYDFIQRNSDELDSLEKATERKEIISLAYIFYLQGRIDVREENLELLEQIEVTV